MKILFLDGIKYNFTSFIGKEKAAPADFVEFNEGDPSKCSQEKFIKKIRTKRGGLSFFTDKKFINIREILKEPFTILKKKYKKKLSME